MKLEPLGEEKTFTELGKAKDDVGHGFKSGLLKADVWVGMVEYQRVELRIKI